MNLLGLIPAPGIPVMRAMFAFGKNAYGQSELTALFKKYASSAFTNFWSVRADLVRSGLLEEIVDEAPIADAIRDANLQEVL